MDSNAMAIAALCSHLAVSDDVKPLEPREWNELAKLLVERQMQPMELLRCSSEALSELLSGSPETVERLQRLLDRSGSLSFELSRYEAMGIHVVTRADGDYPKLLKQKLGNSCPPLFYCAGDMALLDKPSVGFAGSRDVSEEDVAFTRGAVEAVMGNGYQVVTGGAKGVDRAAEQAALSEGGCAVSYLSDSLLRKIKDNLVVGAVQSGRLLLLSVAKPDAGFNTGIAMMRNRYIYAQSSGTVVVKAELNKGGTWAGAVENLRHRWCKLFCRENAACPGNTALIAKGAIPITSDWTGNPEAYDFPAEPQYEQASLFD